MSLCDYVSVVVESMYTCKTGIFQTSLCAYVCVVVEGMYTCIECIYTCKNGNFGKKTLYLCLCSCRGYLHMYNWEFWQ